MRYCHPRMKTQTIDAIGLLAGLLTTISFLPQLIAVYRTKSARDLSYAYLLTFASGIVLWLVYGFLIDSPPVKIANAATLTLLVLIIILKARYDRKT